jgi:predicted lactoylglutathione lyase
VPIDHVNLPVSDLDASRAFYRAALAPFGYKLVFEGEYSLGFGRDAAFVLDPDGHNIEAVYHGPRR